MAHDATSTSGRFLDRSYPLLIALTLFGFPVISTLPVALGLSSRMVTVPYRVLVVAASVLTAAVAIRARRPMADRRLLGCVGLFAAALLLRMFWDRAVVPLPIDLPWGDYFMQMMGITILPVLPFMFTVEQSWVVRAHRIGLWMGLVASGAIAIGVVMSIRSYATGGRLETDVLNPISIGAAGVSLYIVSSTLPSKGKPFTTAARAVGAFAGVALCLLSASKGPLLALLAAIGVQYAIPLGPRTAGQKFRQFVALLVLAALAVAGAILASGDGKLLLLSRIANAASDPAVAARWLMWRDALQQFNGSPLLGDSFVESTMRFYPHNAFIESMMTAGVIGLVLFTLIVLMAMISTFRSFRNGTARWFGMIFLQQLIAMQTSGSLYFSQAFWAALLLVVAVRLRPDAARLSDPMGEPPLAAAAGGPR